MDFSKLSAYELIEKHHSKDLDSEAYLLRHKKTGARVAVLENDDDNKVFYIGFRTPPKDSTGVAHIVEHTVLCGSDKYPCKDPFVELCKSSLNTFLNAMTYPDKTVYPVASCNDKDFRNLMDVYLDAVFHPNIYHEEKIFMQEGWHYECEDVNEPITINGVVYNEMKGAFSNPDDVFAREILNSLYPDTTYSVESGGDPEVIPELTYEDFLAFHSRYYHPSNSYIYLYGDGDMTERLVYMDEAYLSKYDQLKVDSFPGKQEAFIAPKVVLKEYPISEEESEEKATYLSYNITTPTNENIEVYMAMDLIDRALCGNGGVLRKALTEKGIGSEVDTCLEQCLYQPYYSITVKNADESDQDAFVKTIEEVLADVVKNGFDKDALYAAINRSQFKLREADFGHYPKGLIYGLNALETWLYDDAKPFACLELLSVLDGLKNKVEEGYFEKIVEEIILKNSHKTILTLVPKKGLQTKKDKELVTKLENYKASLSKEEIQAIIDRTNDLKAYQEEEDSKEAKASLPKLSREDLKREARTIHNEEIILDGEPAVFHEYATGGITYVQMLFDYSDIPATYLPYVTFLFDTLGSIDTKNYTYDKLNYQMGMKIGGLGSASHITQKIQAEDDIRLYAGIKFKCMQDQLKDAVILAEEILFDSKLEDTVRLKELIAESRSTMEGTLMSSSHTVAYNYAYSMFSKTAAVAEKKGGLGFYEFLVDMDEHFEEKKEILVENLKKVRDYIFRKDNLLFDIGCEKEHLANLNGLFDSIKNKLKAEKIDLGKEAVSLQPKKKTGFTYSGQVQYVCRAGSYKKDTHDFHGSLQVLKTILGYDYLWQKIRVMGGAYGCMSKFELDGNCHFVSYRDPHLTETIDVFEKCAEYIKNLNLSEEELLSYIISTMGGVDAPVSVPSLIERDRAFYLKGDAVENLQKRRDELLNTTLEDIKNMADYIADFMKDDILVVVGNEEMIKQNSEIFDEIKPLVVSKNA